MFWIVFKSKCLSTRALTHRGTVHSNYSSVPQNDRCRYNHQAERFPGNSNLPFSCDFGDLETEVH